MPRELNRETSIVKMRLARRDISRDQAQGLLAVARTSVPGEIRAKYLRGQGISTVQADVRVQAYGESGLTVDAVIRVKLTYKGDMVRSSPRTRNKINNRLQDVAQQVCSRAVLNEILPKAGES